MYKNNVCDATHLYQSYYYMYFNKFKYADYHSFAYVRDYEQKKFKREARKRLKNK